jgi:hypothetical protein
MPTKEFKPDSPNCRPNIELASASPLASVGLDGQTFGRKLASSCDDEERSNDLLVSCGKGGCAMTRGCAQQTGFLQAGFWAIHA